MNLIQKLVGKLGRFTSSRQGQELVFACPKCSRPKFGVNVKKLVFNCFRCGYSGRLGEIIDALVDKSEGFYQDLSSPSTACEINEERAAALFSHAFGIVEIPGFTSFGENNRDIYKADIQSFCVKKLDSKFLPVAWGWGTSMDWKLKGRLVIPIRERGAIVSYVARAVDGSEPKEISGPNKSQYLYGLDDIKEGDEVFIVEGIFDCERLRRANYNSVAMLGSHLSDIQAGKLLAKHPKSIYLMLDGDQAGEKGSRESYEKLIGRTEVAVHWLKLPPGTDPDELTDEELRQLLKP